MQIVSHASLQSQLKSAPCLCEDTEEMFWLRELDDYESRVRLGNLLSGQYRFREAVDAYLAAQRIRADDPMLYLRLGGAYLTLRRFAEAKSAYDACRAYGGKEQAVAYPMGVWHYLRGEYAAAAARFAGVLPCEDALGIAVLYWHALSCMRGDLPDNLLPTYRAEMQVGHHTAYRSAVEVFLGRKTAESAYLAARQDENDLDAVVALYGVAVYLEQRGEAEQAREARRALLRREAVWPCISYLAAWNDAENTAL